MFLLLRSDRRDEYHGHRTAREADRHFGLHRSMFRYEAK